MTTVAALDGRVTEHDRRLKVHDDVIEVIRKDVVALQISWARIIGIAAGIGACTGMGTWGLFAKAFGH